MISRNYKNIDTVDGQQKAFEEIIRIKFLKRVANRYVSQGKKLQIETNLIKLIKSHSKEFSNEILTKSNMSKNRYTFVKQRTDKNNKEMKSIFLSLKHPQLKILFSDKTIETVRESNLEALDVKVSQNLVKEKMKLRNNTSIEVEKTFAYVNPSSAVKLILKTKKVKVINSSLPINFTKEMLLQCEESRNPSDILIMSQFDDFNSFISSSFFRTLRMDEVPKSNITKIDCTLDALKTFRESRRGASYHTQFSIKNEKIILVSFFHEGKQSTAILDQMKELGFFSEINKKKYYFVDGSLYEIKWRSPNDVPGMCALLGVDWKLVKRNGSFTWEKSVPTLIKENNIWKLRFGVDGKTFDLNFLKNEHHQINTPYLDPSVVEMIYCSGHGNESIFKEFLNQLTIELSKLENGNDRISELQIFCIKNKISYKPEKVLNSTGKPYTPMVGFRVHEHLFGKMKIVNNRIQDTQQILDLSRICRGTSFANNAFLKRLWVFDYVNMHSKQVHPLIQNLYINDIRSTTTQTTIDGNSITIPNSIIDVLNLH